MTEAAGASGFARHAWMDRWKEYLRLGKHVSERPESISVRDDDLCLFRSVTSADDDEVRPRLDLVTSEVVSDTAWLGRYRMYSHAAEWTTFVELC